MKRVAIIGCGRMAGTIDDERPPGSPLYPSTHAGAFAGVADTTVVAAVNRGQQRLQEFCSRWRVAGAYQDYREMLAAESPDVVSICTPQESHAQITIDCAQAGVKGIICEKAMCSSMTEAAAILAALERFGVCYNLGVQRRFRLDCVTARELIDQGEIGHPRWFHLTSQGALMRTFSHYFDVMSMLLKDPAPVRVSGRLADRKKDAPCGYDPATNRFLDDPPLRWATVEFAGGEVGQVSSPGGVAFREWRVAGTTGELAFVDDGRPPSWRTPDGPRQFPAFAAVDSPTVRMVQDLLHGMQTGAATRAGAHCSAAVTEICLAVAESHRLGGQPVDLPLANRDLLVPSP